MPAAEFLDDLRIAVRGGMRRLGRLCARAPSFRPWTPLVVLVVLVVLTPPLGLFAVAVQVWSGVAEEVVDSPVLRALLATGPVPGHYLCAAFLYGVGALVGAAIFAH